MHELDGGTLLAILGMTAISVITRGFFFISEREWTLPEWAERGLQCVDHGVHHSVLCHIVCLPAISRRRGIWPARSRARGR